jgi:hypothetical protein
MIFDADNNFYNVMVYFDAFVYTHYWQSIQQRCLDNMLYTYLPLSPVSDQRGCTDR